MLHRPHACFVPPSPTNGGAARLVLSPNLERPDAAVGTIAFILPPPRVA
jgi:hypothetical protein